MSEREKLRESQLFIIAELEKQRKALDDQLDDNKMERDQTQQLLNVIDANQCRLVVDIAKIDDAIEFTKNFTFPDA